MLRALLRRAFEHPLLIALALTCAAHAVIRPFGDFPLNDDFTFARVAKTFADSGALRVELPSAPSVVGQALIVWPFIKLFGFSHTLLRLLTMALGALGLWALDRLFRRAGAVPAARTVLLCAIAVCPLYLYLSTTYMTELWGHVPMLLGVEFWFWSRSDGRRMRAWVGGAAAAGLIAATFWIRQYSALAFPALALAAVAGELAGGKGRPWRTWLPALLLHSMIFAALVALYFPWARWTGNLRTEFKDPLAELLRVEVRVLAIGATSVVAYLTAFLVPALALLHWRRRHLLPAIIVVFTFAAGVFVLRSAAVADFGVPATLNKLFPFGGNVLHNAGLGPVTLTDVYLFGLDHPSWPKWPWVIVTGCVLLASALWTPAPGAILELFRRERATQRFELAVFAGAFGVASWVIPVQAFKLNAFDRYWLPCVLAVAIALSVLLVEALPRARLIGAMVLLLPLAAFTTLALHDEFRWSEARWALVKHARSEGVSPRNLDGGYEVNGWIAADDVLAKRPPERCIGACGCQSGWWCQDASWRVAMNALHGYDVVREIQPAYALTDGPGLKLLRRKPQRSLTRYLRPEGGHGASTDPPPGVTREASWRVMTEPGEGLTAIEDFGYLYERPMPGDVPVVRCEVRGVEDRFYSTDPSCEGQHVLGLAGYTPG